MLLSTLVKETSYIGQQLIKRLNAQLYESSIPTCPHQGSRNMEEWAEKNVKTWKSCEMLSFRHDIADALQHYLIISMFAYTKLAQGQVSGNLSGAREGLLWPHSFQQNCSVTGWWGSLSYGQIAGCPCSRRWPTSIQIWPVLTRFWAISNKDESEDTKGPGRRVGN